MKEFLSFFFVFFANSFVFLMTTIAQDDTELCFGSNASFTMRMKDALSDLKIFQDSFVEFELQRPLNLEQFSKLVDHSKLQRIAISGWLTDKQLPDLFEYIVFDQLQEPDLNLSVESVRSQLKTLRTNFFKTTLEGAIKLDPVVKEGHRNLLDGITKVIKGNKISTNVSIVRLELNGSPNALSKIANALNSSKNIEAIHTAYVSCSRAAKVTKVIKERQVPTLTAPEASTQASLSSSLGGTSWCNPPPGFSSSYYPNCYYNMIDYGFNGLVPTSLHLLWANPERSGNITYEHDLFMDNRDGVSLWSIGSSPFPSCMPGVKYLISTFPPASRPYVDTRFNFTECETRWVPFTLGLADLNGVLPATWYLISIYPYQGNVPFRMVDNALLQAQRGYRSPPVCYSTWCSFADAIKTIRPYSWEGPLYVPSETGGVLWN